MFDLPDVHRETSEAYGGTHRPARLTAESPLPMGGHRCPSNWLFGIGGTVPTASSVVWPLVSARHPPLRLPWHPGGGETPQGKVPTYCITGARQGLPGRAKGRLYGTVRSVCKESYI
jgi:hypothetical protein